MYGAGSIGEAFESYVKAVREGRFPGPEHAY
jgi:ketopantoate hydroxymethyltransferase